jgi:alkanesulfonate monooxygenase SsuD/methylene tetrahydromethanopterin reductase-like flavin-dependent oxidoreductase (luciferase family)
MSFDFWLTFWAIASVSRAPASEVDAGLPTNQNTRHPLITASIATTMQRLTGGRFTLGLGRGVDAVFGAYGLPPITSAPMVDFVGLLRRLLARRGHLRRRRPRRGVPDTPPRCSF